MGSRLAGSWCRQPIITCNKAAVVLLVVAVEILRVSRRMTDRCRRCQAHSVLDQLRPAAVAKVVSKRQVAAVIYLDR